MSFPLFFRVLPVFVLLLSACSAPPPEPGPVQPDAAPEVSDRSECPETRPQVCTMIYAPVCGRQIAGTEETYASGCNACADDTVVDYREGTCEETAL